MISKDLAQTLLFDPVVRGADSLMILTAYGTPNMASWLIKSLQEKKLGPISISLILGMIPYNGISVSAHEGFKELHGKQFEGMSAFSCGYMYENPAVHGNLYVWLKQGCPTEAFVGSPDFMQNSFLSSRIELAETCNPDEAYALFEQAESKSIYCNHHELENTIQLKPSHVILDDDGVPQTSVNGDGIFQTELSFLTSKGNTGARSGLNWGQRGNRNKNEAYIPLPRKIASSGFFPLEGQHFMAETDDGHTLLLRIEQQNDKAITTPLSNAQLGEYFRNRLGLANGAYVSRSDLENYGRTSVTFYKIDDEEFYMDFSSGNCS